MGLAMKKERHFTSADFFEWELDEGERYELVDGEAYLMAGATLEHQEISGNLFLLFGNFLKGKPCKVFHTDYAVRLFPSEDDSDDTVVLPDLFVVCDRKKLAKRACDGAPDLIIEILSPSTSRYDRLVKFRKYQEAGVKEYWIVDPGYNTIQVHILENGRYVTYMYNEEDVISVSALPGLQINAREIFPEPEA
jgi:Uma2 family endonuclease